jgi:glutamate--cysteine ligase
MSNPGEADATPITSVRQLADYLASGCKPPADFRIGTEHEKFGFRLADLLPPPYQPDGIAALLTAMQGDAWQPIETDGNLIGLSHNGGSVSLEPAGQLELSGAPLATLHQTRHELEQHFEQVRRAAAPLRLGFSPLGFHPTMPRESMPWMPKARYAIMRRYMPTVGSLGLDMMTRTCTVQVNLDFASEADMVRKLRVSLALQPVATALFANSPFTEGRPNGFLSYRAHVWSDTDNARSGMPAEFFAEDFGFARYVEWLLDVPMYFVARGDRLIDLAGCSFRDFMAGRLADKVPGPATLGDFADHTTTAFTDVRLKRFLEMRGADAGSPQMMLGQSAFWVGLLYDPATLEAAYALVRRHPWEDYRRLRAEVPRHGLAAPWQGNELRGLARDVVALARDGLRARGRREAAGEDESGYLEPVAAIAEGAPSQAETWLQRYWGPWRQDVTPIWHETHI